MEAVFEEHKHKLITESIPGGFASLTTAFVIES